MQLLLLSDYIYYIQETTKLAVHKLYLTIFMLSAIENSYL